MIMGVLTRAAGWQTQTDISWNILNNWQSNITPVLNLYWKCDIFSAMFTFKVNICWYHGALILYLQLLSAIIANVNKFSAEKVVLSKLTRCAAHPPIRESRRSRRLWRWWGGGRRQGARSWGRLSIRAYNWKIGHEHCTCSLLGFWWKTQAPQVVVWQLMAVEVVLALVEEVEVWLERGLMMILMLMINRFGWRGGWCWCGAGAGGDRAWPGRRGLPYSGWGAMLWMIN